VYEIINATTTEKLLKPHYGCTVEVDGRTFKTDTYHSTHKEAQQEGAKRAYDVLVGNSIQADKLPNESTEWDDLSHQMGTTSLQPTMSNRLTTEINHYPSPPDFDLNYEANFPPSKKLSHPMFIIDKKPDQAAQKKNPKCKTNFF